MGRAEYDEERGQTPDAPRTPPRPDRLAEALRANLKRRKAQTRARSDGRTGGPMPEAIVPDRDG